MVDIVDYDGTKRDENWLKNTYGASLVRPVDEKDFSKVFRLVRVEISDGPAVIQVAVRDENSNPIQGQPIANHWDDSNLPDLTNKGLKTLYFDKAIYQNTSGKDGDTGFGLGDGSYIRDLEKGGPHTAWVLSTTYPSDGLARIGMLGGTNHRGPLRPTFQLQKTDTVIVNPPIPPIPNPNPDRNLLSAHLMPGIDNNDIAQLRRIRPRSVKIVNDLQKVTPIVYAATPNSLLILRDHPLSEQKDDMRKDPIGTGIRHANEWKQKRDSWAFAIPNEQLLHLGINEPDVFKPSQIENTVAYTVAFLDQMTKHGLRAGALNLSVGWPANTGKDTPPNWKPFEPVLAAILRGNHVLILHEYWSHTGIDGPTGDKWGWWAGRALKCPWNVPIIIGECGIEEAVITGKTGHGWKDFYLNNPQIYVDQLLEYDRRMSVDSRIHSLEVFLWRPSPGFESCDVKDIMYLFPENNAWDNALIDNSNPPVDKDFDNRLLAEGEKHLLIPFNPNAALQKAIFADGFIPNSNEFPFEGFIAQRSELLTSPRRVRIYYVKPNDWGNVQYVESK